MCTKCSVSFILEQVVHISTTLFYRADNASNTHFSAKYLLQL
jgi:hypothetical protein